MSADRARSIVTLAAAAFAVVVLVSAHSRGAPILPPPAPETTIQPAPVAPAQNGAGAQQADGDDQHDVLTRGPVHEAFAEQFNADPVEGLIVPKAPPEPIDELPPETMPEGNNIQWVSGYWGWDDERQDFIWISGLWRDIPPGQRWVPGYWTEAATGFQWVSGFWTGAENAELEYLPQPPESLEQGPNVAAPSEEQFWVPGTWSYVDTSYRWRPGYWAPAYDDWVWVPDRYIWTPYGFVFSPGYYDYRLPVRAVCFAPVYFSHVHWWHAHRRPFCPSVVLDVGPLTMHWFVRPNYCHYYFGDFYATNYYTGWGLQPWYTCNYGFGGFGGWRGRHCHYDPLLVFYTGYHRRHHNVDFGDRMHRWHDHYRDHADERPRWTAREQDHYLDELKKMNRQNARLQKLGRPLDDFVANPTEHDQKFVKLDGRQRDRHKQIANETVQLATLRHDVEAEGGRRRKGNDGAGGKRGDAAVTLPGVGDGGGNAGDGDNGRRARKLKLPGNQGAGDQTVVNVDGNTENTNRRQRKIKLPDGPPGGGATISDANVGDGNNRSPRRGRGNNVTDNTPGSGGNDDGQGSNNNNNKRARRGSQVGQSDLPQVNPADGNDVGSNPDAGNGSSKGGGRNRVRSNNNSGGANPNFDVGGGTLPGTGESGTSGSGSGSNKGRTPRRGSSSGSGGNSSGSSDFNVQPLPDGQGSGAGGGNNSSGGNKSRSRRGSGSGSSSDLNPSGGGSSGSGGSGSGGGNSGGSNFRRKGGDSGPSFNFNNSGGGGGSSGGGSQGQGSGGGNSGGSQKSGRQGGSGSINSGGGNSSGGSGSINSSGGSSRRNSGGGGGGDSGRRGKKPKE